MKGNLKVLLCKLVLIKMGHRFFAFIQYYFPFLCSHLVVISLS